MAFEALLDLEKIAVQFSENGGGGVKGRLELCQKFIFLGTVTCPYSPIFYIEGQNILVPPLPPHTPFDLKLAIP